MAFGDKKDPRRLAGAESRRLRAHLRGVFWQETEGDLEGLPGKRGLNII